MEILGNNFDVWNAVITALSIVAGAVGFLVKRLFKRIDEHQSQIQTVEDEVSNLKVKLVENHPNKNDFDSFKRDITQMLVQIISPINTKLENIEMYLRTQVPKRKDD